MPDIPPTRQVPLAEKDLRALGPEWLEEGGRQGLGLVFQCPRHSYECRLTLRFLRPLDGGHPPRASHLYGHMFLEGRVAFETLSLWTERPQKNHIIEVHGHGRFYLLDGTVYLAWGLG